MWVQVSLPTCRLYGCELWSVWRKGPSFPHPGVRFCKPERYLWKPLWPKDISAGDIFGPESVSVKIYYWWNTCWATSPNPPGKISFRDVFKERYLFLQKRTMLTLNHTLNLNFVWEKSENVKYCQPFYSILRFDESVPLLCTLHFVCFDFLALMH